jgi:hypothetical protein
MLLPTPRPDIHMIRLSLLELWCHHQDPVRSTLDRTPWPTRSACPRPRFWRPMGASVDVATGWSQVRRHVCGINREVVERAWSVSNKGSDGSAEYFCR